ncbi:hypothetical protein [Egicoccus sp. AB-alg6-2]|uniref:hypothetical protein n=1 Tax=Egicoccus sp. AB-alg6-2 TaxID=3242692 RepID=UPI00359E0FAE
MTADPARPWWATAEGSEHLDDRDPVQAHREARRGAPGPDAETTDGGETTAAHDPDVCGVCPWCTGLRLLATSHPDAVAHLTEAARHLTHAVRALLAGFPAGADQQRSDRNEPFEHIDLD